MVNLRVMTLGRRTFIFTIFFASLGSFQAQAAPCTPQQLLENILGTRNYAREWLARVFQKQTIKNFKMDRYREAKLEFELLKPQGKLPTHASIAEDFEKSVALYEVEIEDLAYQNLPSFQSVLESGTERQKRRLAKWVNQYSRKKLTVVETREAATELAYALHDVNFELSDLYRYGGKELVQKALNSSFHRELILRKIRESYLASGEMSTDRWIDRVKDLYRSNPGQITKNIATNAYFILNAKTAGNVFLLTLRDKKTLKIAAEDLTTLFREGGSTSPHFEKIAAKYISKSTQPGLVAYNAFRNTVNDICYALWVKFGIDLLLERNSYKKELEKEHHS